MYMGRVRTAWRSARRYGRRSYTSATVYIAASSPRRVVVIHARSTSTRGTAVHSGHGAGVTTHAVPCRVHQARRGLLPK